MQSEYLDFIDSVTRQLKAWSHLFIERTPNIILALLVFVTGFYCARLCNRLIMRILVSRKVKLSARIMLGNLISVVIVLLFIIIALNILDLDNMLRTVLAGAGVAGLAIGLALQGTLSNTFSGITLSFTKDIRIGDQIETNNFIGTVTDINMRVIKLQTPDGNIVLIPNRTITENPIKNYSTSPHSNIVLTCGVAYDSDLDLVKQITLETISKEMNYQEQQDHILFFYTEFADSSINFELRFYAPSKNLVETAIMKSNAIIALKKAFDRYGINIPFPIRTLEFAPGHSPIPAP